MAEWVCNRCESVQEMEVEDLEDNEDDNEEDAEAWCECGDFRLFTAL